MTTWVEDFHDAQRNTRAGIAELQWMVEGLWGDDSTVLARQLNAIIAVLIASEGKASLAVAAGINEDVARAERGSREMLEGMLQWAELAARAKE